MNTKEMTCKVVYCIHVSKNGRRGMSGVTKELLVSEGPPFRFPSEVHPYLCSLRRCHERCSRVGCCMCSLHRICSDGAILVTEQANVAKCVERVGLREGECA